MTDTPQVDGPRDVPALRTHLEAKWKTQFKYKMETTTHDVNTNTWVAEQTLTRTAGEWEIAVLKNATMWWVTEDMCDLLAAAEEGLPDSTILEPELIPHPSGLVVFAKPLAGIDAETGQKTVLVHALVWGLVNLPQWPGYIDDPRGAEALAVSSYRKLVFDGGQTPYDVEAALNSGAISSDANWQEVRGTMWAPLGRSDWLLGTDTVHAHTPLSDDGLASMIEDRRRVATMWLLQAQAGITQTELSQGGRGERRRAERSGEPAPVVRLVDINRRASRSSVRSSDDESERRHLSVRSLVDPHWRRHPYHPSCEKCSTGGRACGNHVPKYIHAFWRGPEDAPVSQTRKVRIWKEVR